MQKHILCRNTVGQLIHESSRVTHISKIYWTRHGLILNPNRAIYVQSNFLSQQNLCIHHLFREQACLYFIKRMKDVLQGCQHDTNHRHRMVIHTPHMLTSSQFHKTIIWQTNLRLKALCGHASIISDDRYGRFQQLIFFHSLVCLLG